MRTRKNERQAGKVCSCGEPASTKGLCGRCYQRERYRALTPKFSRTCEYPGCSRKPSRDESVCSFHRVRKGFCSAPECSIVAHTEGLCHRHYREKQSLSRTPEQVSKAAADASLRARASRAGTTPEAILALRELQGGLCAICSTTMTIRQNDGWSECIDHDHDKGAPRGLLCRSCNVSLGIYEKWQKDSGLVLEPYDRYLADPPVTKLGHR